MAMELGVAKKPSVDLHKSVRRSTRTAAIMGEFIREVDAWRERARARTVARNGVRFLNIGRERRRTRTTGRGVRRTCRRKASCDSSRPESGVIRMTGHVSALPLWSTTTTTDAVTVAREKRSGGLIKGFTFATSHALASRLRAVDRDTSIVGSQFNHRREEIDILGQQWG